MFDSFIRTETLGDFSGQNQEPKNPNDPNYSKSKLRVVPFDHTFTFLSIDVNQCKEFKKFFLHYIYEISNAYPFT